MRENRLKKALRQGKVVAGMFIYTPCSEFVEILGDLGYDFVIICLEHGTFGIEAAKNSCMAADAHSITPLIRVLRNDQHLIQQALDIGAQGVVVPHINTAEDAIRAVQAAKYPLLGTRGFCPFIRAGRYGKDGFEPEFTEQANEETMVIPIIEDACAFDNLESILAVKGVDAIYPGPADLSVSLGLAGQINHPSVAGKIEWAITLAKAKGMPSVYSHEDIEDTSNMIKKGAQILLCGADVYTFRRASLVIKEGLQKVIEA